MNRREGKTSLSLIAWQSVKNRTEVKIECKRGQNDIFTMRKRTRLTTLAELSRMYVDFKEDGSTDEESFTDWLRNATDKNGALDEITNNSLQGWLTYHSLHSSDADLPVIPMDWITESPISTWGINGMQDFIVVREWSDYIYDVYDNPVAVGVFVMKPKKVRQ